MTDKLNSSEIQRILQSLNDQLHQSLEEGNRNVDTLLQISVFHPQKAEQILIGCIQPILGICYLAFFVFVTFIFIRESMTNVVHISLCVSNFFSNLSNVLSVPINPMMFYISNIEAPAPYPWCFFYFINEFSLRPIFNLTSICLTILISINRLCSVYYPFKATIWFRKSRIRLYIITTSCISTSTGIVLHLTYRNLAFMSHFDDVWGKNEVHEYVACSLLPSLNQTDITAMPVMMRLISTSMTSCGILLLVVFNIFLIVKIYVVKSKRKELCPLSTPQMENVADRLDLLSRVSFWVITTFIIVEIPVICSMALNLYISINVALYGESSIDLDSVLYKAFQITYAAKAEIAPLNLVIFVMLSRTTRKAMKTRFCVGFDQ